MSRLRCQCPRAHQTVPRASLRFQLLGRARVFVPSHLTSPSSFVFLRVRLRARGAQQNSERSQWHHVWTHRRLTSVQELVAGFRSFCRTERHAVISLVLGGYLGASLWVCAGDGNLSRVTTTLEPWLSRSRSGPSIPHSLLKPERRLCWSPVSQNRGNGSLLNKLMTSRYPLSALLMVFSEHLRHTGVRPEVRWAPRETNAKADRLANGDSGGFSPSLRARVFPPQRQWHVLE